MTGRADPLQYASHSRFLGCMPLDCVSQCAIDSIVSRSQSCGSSRVALQQAINPLLACSTVRLLSPGQFSNVGTRDTPLLEVCPTTVSPRYLVFHKHFSWVSAHHLSGSLHSNLDVERIVTAIWGPRSGPHLEYAVSAQSLRLGHSPDVRRPWS